MSPDQNNFLNQRHLPSRLTAKEAGWLLGFSTNDITVLTSNRMLKPVGRPSQNSTKYYSTLQVGQLAGDVKWLDRATALLNKHWRDKNGGRNPGAKAE
jgi:hypothetical protein